LLLTPFIQTKKAKQNWHLNITRKVNYWKVQKDYPAKLFPIKT